MTPILDKSVLTELKELSPEDPKGFIGELFEAYRKQANGDVNLIQTAFKRQGWAEIAQAAHRLKSSSFQLGAARASALAAEIEAITRPGSGDESLERLVNDLSVSYVETERQIQAYLDQNCT